MIGSVTTAKVFIGKLGKGLPYHPFGTRGDLFHPLDADM
jgi:hypothetical protein